MYFIDFGCLLINYGGTVLSLSIVLSSTFFCLEACYRYISSASGLVFKKKSRWCMSFSWRAEGAPPPPSSLVRKWHVCHHSHVSIQFCLAKESHWYSCQVSEPIDWVFGFHWLQECISWTLDVYNFTFGAHFFFEVEPPYHFFKRAFHKILCLSEISHWIFRAE